jgi:hypothetical protein
VLVVAVNVVGVALQLIIAAATSIFTSASGLAVRVVGILEKMTEGHQWTIGKIEKMSEKITELEKRGTWRSTPGRAPPLC